MPIKTTRWETGKIMSGEAEGITRMYHGGSIPHEVGKKNYLTTDYSNKVGSAEPYATVTIKSIRPMTVGDRRKDNRYAKMDGFGSAAEWYGHFCRMYGNQPDDAVVHRIQLRIDEMEKV